MSNDATITWHGERFEQALDDHLARQLTEAAEHLRDRIERYVGRSSDEGRRPSRPGEFPRRATATLSRSIFAEVNRRPLEAAVFTSLPYARWLEFGTSRMLARPFFRRTALVEQTALTRILTRPLR